MNHEKLKELIKELDGDSLDTLFNKNSRYSSADDVLHNFVDGGEIFGGTPAEACWGYLTKHLVALRDMVKRNDFSNREDFKEKCQDSINYIRFLWAIGNEINDGIPEHDRGLLRDIVESLELEKRKKTSEIEDIVFALRSDAQETLSAMQEVVDKYGYVTIADLYDLAGLRCKSYRYSRMGWTDLSSAVIVLCDRGINGRGYTIQFPNPVDVL